MAFTVKARKHYGAKSLNLTIPTKIVEEYDLNAGDIFELRIEEEKKIKLIYSLAYKNK